MKKLNYLFLILVLGQVMVFQVNAQIKVLSCDFDTGIPSTWTQDPNSSQNLWVSGASGISNVNPLSGSNYAYLYVTNYMNPVKLITPMTTISSLETPVVSFYLAQPSSSFGKNDSLKVYYRVSATDTWSLLDVINSAYNSWSNIVLSLDTINTNSIQIAFEYNYGSGRGIGLDNIYIGEPKHCTKPTSLRSYRITHESALLMWSYDEATETSYVKVSTTPMTDLSNTADIYDGTVSYDNQLSLSNLLSNTSYYYYVKTDCGNNDVSEWSEEGQFTTLCLPTPLPYSENFENHSPTTFPNCWYREMQSGGDWGSNSAPSTFIPSVSNAVAEDVHSLYMVG